MKIIHSRGERKFKDALLDLIGSDRGNRLVVATGYVFSDRNTIGWLGSALEHWLREEDRAVYFFVGDWREKAESVEAAKDQATQGLAALICNYEKLSRSRLVFVPLLHAKCTSMWTVKKGYPSILEWVTIGSSNITPAALNSDNFELDLILDGIEVTPNITHEIGGFISEMLDAEAEDWDLNFRVDERVDAALESRLEFRERERKEMRAQGAREMEKAREESDRRQGIEGRE